MNAMTAMPARRKLLVAGAAIALLAAGPCASASVVRINFSGGAGSGYADLTIQPDIHASSTCTDDIGTPTQDPVLLTCDPAGAAYITGATGSFGGSTITGIMPTSPGTPPPFGDGFEQLPASFSWVIPNATPAAGSYDNLYYAGNSPLVCPPQGNPPYTFSGGFLDIFGVVFQLGGAGTPYDGDYVGLWSDGYMPTGLTFGMNVYAPDGSGGFTIASSQFAGVAAAVPEPRFLWLFGAGILGLFAWRRRVEIRKQTADITD